MSTAPPPGVRLFGLIAGFIRTQAIGVFADLGAADAIAGGTTSTAELAAQLGADADALGRVLRVLEADGVVAQAPPGTWRLTEVGELLRDGVPGSMRHQARMFAGEQYEAWADAAHSVRTGEPAFPLRFGGPYFAWMRDQPAAAERFDLAMAGTATARLLPLLDRDWSDSATVVDVGGGNATLLERLLGAQPHLSGTSFDLPDVARRAAERVAGTAVANRLATEGGDFFAEVPAGADVYVLAQILHDWDDADAVRLLAACRRAAAPHTRLLVLEQIVPDGPEPSPVKLLDLHMLVLLAGRERTLAEFESVFGQAGWRLAARADGPRSSLLEAVPG